jgi:hypothetical protein
MKICDRDITSACLLRKKTLGQCGHFSRTMNARHEGINRPTTYRNSRSGAQLQYESLFENENLGTKERTTTDSEWSRAKTELA